MWGSGRGQGIVSNLYSWALSGPWPSVGVCPPLVTLAFSLHGLLGDRTPSPSLPPPPPRHPVARATADSLRDFPSSPSPRSRCVTACVCALQRSERGPAGFGLPEEGAAPECGRGSSSRRGSSATLRVPGLGPSLSVPPVDSSPPSTSPYLGRGFPKFLASPPPLPGEISLYLVRTERPHNFSALWGPGFPRSTS